MTALEPAAPLAPDCRRDEEWGPWLRRVAYEQRLENIA